MDKGNYRATRARVFVVAIVVGSLSAVGFFVVEYSRTEIPAWSYAAIVNLLGVFFGLSFVSLVWEFFVRKAHGEDLRHHLRLGASVASSGLQEMNSYSSLEWNTLLKSASMISVLASDADWLDRNSHLLVEVAQRRPLKVTIAVPVAGGDEMKRHATLRGIDAERMEQQVKEVASRAGRLWRETNASARPMRAGSQLRVVEHSMSLGYEIIVIDETTIVSLAAPDDNAGVFDRISFVYEQSSFENHTRLFRSHVEGLDDLDAIEEVAN